MSAVAWPSAPPVAGPHPVETERAAREAARRAAPVAAEVVTSWAAPPAPYVRPGWHRPVRAAIVAVLVLAVVFALGLGVAPRAKAPAPALPDCSKAATVAGWAAVRVPDGGCVLRR